MTDHASTPAPVYRRSSAPNPPLAEETRATFVASAVWEERAAVALQPDLSLELLAKLVLDEKEAVRHMVYDTRRDIPSALLDAALADHPEDAHSIAFQQEAPLAALRVKLFNFATRADIDRYLLATTADPDLAEAFRAIPKTSSNAMVTLDALMRTLRP